MYTKVAAKTENTHDADRSTNKLQNYIIIKFSQYENCETKVLVGNLFLGISCKFYYDDIIFYVSYKHEMISRHL